MKTRILTAIGIAAVLIPVGVFSGTYAYGITVAVVCAIAVFEMLRCIGIEKNLFVLIPCMALGAFLPLWAKISPDTAFNVLAVSTALLMFWLFSVSLFSHGKLPIDRVGLAFLALVYILWGFCLMVLLRQLPHGQYLFLLPFLGAWVTDSFAYFTGRLLGKHKLIPDVSPKKTVEGAVGGIVFAVIAFVIFGYVVSLQTGGSAGYAALALMAVPVSLVSMIGDLVMSLIKRHCGIKDYGKLLPGHGGILDRFDSVLATSIMLYILCANIPSFGTLF